MWRPKKITFKKRYDDAIYNWSNLQEVTEIYFDDDMVSNAAEFLDGSNPEIQFDLCDGIPGLSHWDWLTLRRSTTDVLFVPIFPKVETHNANNHNWEYEPHAFVRKKGAICIDLQNYEALKKIASGLPNFNKIPYINAKEVIQTLQFDAPMSVLGKFPNKPTFDKIPYVTTNFKHDANILPILSEIIDTWSDSNQTLNFH